MEQTLTDEEKLKVFCFYMGNPIAIVENETDTVLDKIEGIDIVTKTIIAERVSWPLDQIKLILNEKKDIKDETLKQIASEYLGPEHANVNDGALLVDLLLEDETSFAPVEYVHLSNVLKKHLVAVPFIFEKGHWANNKSLFELGLAMKPCI